MQHAHREFRVFGVDHHGDFNFRRGDHQDVNPLTRQQLEHPGRHPSVTAHAQANDRHLGDIDIVGHSLCAQFGKQRLDRGQRLGGVAVGLEDLGFDLDLRLRLVTFKVTNADEEGDYFDGLAPTLPFACAASDDLTREPWDSAESSTAAALSWLGTGACGQVMSAPATATAPTATLTLAIPGGEAASAAPAGMQAFGAAPCSDLAGKPEAHR